MGMLFSKKYVEKLAEKGVPVAIQPVFDSGVKEYAVYVEGYPDLILGKFKTGKVARTFCKVMGLKVAYDGAF